MNISLFLSLVSLLFVCACLSLFLTVCLCVCLCQSVCLCLSLYVHVCVCLSICASFHLSVCLYFSVWMSHDTVHLHRVKPVITDFSLSTTWVLGFELRRAG